MSKYVLEITPQGVGQVFRSWGTVTTQDRLIWETPEEVALAVFTGGHDVWPELYGENCHRTTYYYAPRDIYEGEIFEQAQKHKIPCVGICRGSQFLCVKAGGRLIQDVRGHGWGHKMKTNDGRILVCNSSHHQMQRPSESAIPLAWAEPRLSHGHYLNGDGDNIDMDREYEVVYYPNINSIGIQGHPEWLNNTHEFVKFSQEVVNQYLGHKNETRRISAAT